MEKIYDLLYEIRPESNFKESSDFIGESLLDSLDIIDLISLINESYDIEIKPNDIVPENFTNVKSISDMINRYNSEK